MLITRIFYDKTFPRFMNSHSNDFYCIQGQMKGEASWVAAWGDIVYKHTFLLTENQFQ
jgi:hypothetical protein